MTQYVLKFNEEMILTSVSSTDRPDAEPRVLYTESMLFAMDAWGGETAIVGALGTPVSGDEVDHGNYELRMLVNVAPGFIKSLDPIFVPNDPDENREIVVTFEA